MLSTASHWVVVIPRVAVLSSELLLAWIHIAKKFFKCLCFYQTTRTFFSILKMSVSVFVTRISFRMILRFRPSEDPQSPLAQNFVFSNRPLPL